MGELIPFPTAAAKRDAGHPAAPASRFAFVGVDVANPTFVFYDTVTAQVDDCATKWKFSVVSPRAPLRLVRD